MLGVVVTFYGLIYVDPYGWDVIGAQEGTAVQVMTVGRAFRCCCVFQAEQGCYA